MNSDPSFDLFVLVGAYLIVGAIASVAAGILLGEFLDRFDAFRNSIQARKTPRVSVGASLSSYQPSALSS